PLWGNRRWRCTASVPRAGMCAAVTSSLRHFCSWHTCCKARTRRGSTRYCSTNNSMGSGMKTITRFLTSAAFLSCSSLALADITANIGWASDYFYRGILQAPTSASAGVDFERNGFYIGTWAADVKDGLEVDGYFGYATEIQDISYSVGF